MNGSRDDGFSASRQSFEAVVSFPEAEGSLALSHAELEDQLEERSREVFRLLFQDHLSPRAEHEARIEDMGRC